MNAMFSRTVLASTLLVAVALLPTGKAVAEDQVELPFELPEAFFGGTPSEYWSPILEPETFKARTPFKAPAGTTLISKGKPVTASVAPQPWAS